MTKTEEFLSKCESQDGYIASTCAKRLIKMVRCLLDYSDIEANCFAMSDLDRIAEGKE